MTYDDAKKYESNQIDPRVDSVKAWLALSSHFENTANMEENGVDFHHKREAGEPVMEVKEARCSDAAGNSWIIKNEYYTTLAQ